MTSSPVVIQGLWVGGPLSTMERLSVASFLAHGHAYHLYVYQPVTNAPRGTCLKDGREVLPESLIFRYRDHASYAGFANFFRYKLLLERGGWWVDTDTICLGHFDFRDDYVFGTEWTPGGEVTPSAGFLRAPAGSPAMADAWDACREKDPATLAWGETGPRLVAEVIRRHDLGRFLRGPATFTPVPYFDWEGPLDPERVYEFTGETKAVHLWNEMWRRAGLDKDASYPPRCLYERLKACYLSTRLMMDSGVLRSPSPEGAVVHSPGREPWDTCKRP
jgi:hypothetical protein